MKGNENRDLWLGGASLWGTLGTILCPLGEVKTTHVVSWPPQLLPRAHSSQVPTEPLRTWAWISHRANRRGSLSSSEILLWPCCTLPAASPDSEAPQEVNFPSSQSHLLSLDFSGGWYSCMQALLVQLVLYAFYQLLLYELLSYTRYCAGHQRYSSNNSNNRYSSK